MKNKIFMILGIFIAVVLLIVGSLALFSPNTLSTITNTCYGGLNILISQASHIPGQEFFHGRATANLGGECFKIAWTEEDVENYLAEGGDSDKGIFGDIVINSQTNTFHTGERSSQIVENYNSKEIDSVLCRDSDCASAIGGERRIVSSNKGFGVYDCLCTYTTERGKFAPFTGGRERHFEATVSIDGLGTETISDEVQSVSFGNQAFFQWSGDLLGTRWIDTPFSYTPFREGNKYVLTSTTYYNLESTQFYVGNLDNTGYYRLDNTDNCVKGTAYFADVRRCINAYNSKVDELLNDRTSQYANQIGFVTGANWDVDQGDLVVDLEPYSTSYPEFTFDIKAEWLGIKYLVGEPRVNCPNDQEGFSGETRQFDLGVTNVADGSGVFALSLDCGILSETISPDRVSLVSGLSQTIRGTAKGTTEQDKTDTCTFMAYALKNPNVRKSCSFAYKTKPRDVCIPGERKCSTDKQYLLICNDAGTAYDESFCTQNCIYDTKEGAKCAEDPNCKEEGGVCTEDKNCCSDLECRSNLCKPIKPGFQWNNLYFLPILLTLGLAGLFGWNGKQKTGQYNWLDFTIGGVLGLGVGLALYWVFSHWLMILLISLIGTGGAIALILIIGGIPLLLFLFNILTKGRVRKTRRDYRSFKRS